MNALNACSSFSYQSKPVSRSFVRRWMPAFVGMATLVMAANADAAEWQIIREQSFIEFTATYGKDKVEGSFPEFSGDIVFDPKAPEKSHISIKVSMDKVKSEDKDAARYLPMAEWFAAKEFPVSEFNVSSVKKISDTEFEAEGTLKLRGATALVKLPFTVDIKDGQGGDAGRQFANMKGTAVIKRLDYGVGQGEWSATDVIANDVDLKIHIDAVSK